MASLAKVNAPVSWASRVHFASIARSSSPARLDMGGVKRGVYALHGTPEAHSRRVGGYRVLMAALSISISTYSSAGCDDTSFSLNVSIR